MLTAADKKMNHRQEFIKYFFHAARNYRYAILKDVYKDFNELPETSDIDLVVDLQDLGGIIRVISKGNHIVKVKTEKKSFASFIKIYFEDLSYLELDLIHRFDRKGKIYMSVTDVLHDTIINSQGLKTAALHHQFIYVILFYMLNKADVPGRYRKYFSQLSQQERSSIFAYITAKFNVHVNTLDDLFDYHNRHRKKLLEKINSNKKNRVPLCWKYKMEYYGDTFRAMFHEQGITITFSGVDGAGKSTILENVKKQLEQKYHHNVKVLRHRPSLLPILSSVRHGKKAAEKKAASTLPRQGTNKNLLSSIVRFAWYYADYVIGRPWIYYRYTSRGITLLYDRYYFDFIVDGRRSNIELNPSLVQKGYSLVGKPEVNIFLYASPEEILKRKQELNESDIRTMTSDYRNLFERLSGKYKKQQYLALDNKDLDATMTTVMKHIISAQ
jgi:thymidylate kinase